MDKQKFPEVARKIAEKYAEEMVAAYVDSVRKYLDSYEEPPDAGDFGAWIEGYGWYGLEGEFKE